MAFAGINYWAVCLAAVASWLAGAAWYSALARPWLIALGKTRAELLGPTGKPSPVPFIVALVAQLVMAWVLAGLVRYMGAGQPTFLDGVLAGLFAWLGFVLTTLATNHRFGGHSARLTLIDSGHWLAVLLIQGAIIGAFGVR
ncbi:MAG TPA: DUF1761 domain-containing protein [Microvirga sp.]